MGHRVVFAGGHHLRAIPRDGDRPDVVGVLLEFGDFLPVFDLPNACLVE